MASINKVKALTDNITMIDRDVSDLRGDLSDLKSTATETTNIMNDTRATVSAMAEAVKSVIRRIDALEAKVNKGHKAPTHWEGKL